MIIIIIIININYLRLNSHKKNIDKQKAPAQTPQNVASDLVLHL